MHVCARVCCALQRRHVSRDAGIPESAAPQNPLISVTAGPGFKRPQMQPSAAAPMPHYANLGSAKITFPFSPTGPLQTVWFSLSEVLHTCFLPRLNHAWQTTKVQMRAAMNKRLRQWAHPRHYCGNDKILWNSLNIFCYFNCKIYHVSDFQQ